MLFPNSSQFLTDQEYNLRGNLDNQINVNIDVTGAAVPSYPLFMSEHMGTVYEKPIHHIVRAVINLIEIIYLRINI